MLELFGVIVFLVALMVFASSRQRRRRTEALSTWAAQRGFSLQKAARVFPELQGFTLFRKFRRQVKIRNVVRGHRATGDFIIFDYTVSSPTGPRESPVSVFTYTVAAFRSASATLPTFEMSPAIFHSVPEALRSALFQEVRFECFPEFSRRFSLRLKKREDEQAIRVLFTGSVLSFFETFDAGHNWSVEGERGWLITYRWREEISAEGYEDFCRHSGSIADLLLKRELPNSHRRETAPNF